MQKFFLFIILLSCTLNADESFSQKLQRLIKKAPPEWMVKQIDQDLAVYKQTGITYESLQRLAAISDSEMTLRIKIQSGQLSYTQNPNPLSIPSLVEYFQVRTSQFINAMKKLSQAILLPNVEFIVTVNDCSYPFNHFAAGPLFVFSKNKNVVTQILIPDLDALNGYAILNMQIKEGIIQFPWEKKHQKVFWRGSSSDGNYDPNYWYTNARAKLVLSSVEFPQAIDAKFTNYVNLAQDNPELKNNPKYLGSYVSQKDSLRYKYLMDIDGVTCGWSRFYWTLYSNSVVFKQMTDNIEWFYGGLIPDYHYISIKKDMSDLYDKWTFAVNNDKKMQRIAEQATQFAEENLSEEMIYYYLYLAIVRYAQLQRF